MRVRWLGVKGRLSSGISDSDVTITSDGLADLPEVVSPDYTVLVLDPDGLSGRPEVVYVTDHAASATSATITRGEETGDGGSVARAHEAGVAWYHAATPQDYEGMPVGTTAGTVAAGDDSRITGALSAATAASTYQPLDADLTAIAALSTTSFGRSLLTLANAGALLAAGLVVNTVAAAGTTETLDGDDYNIHDITLDESVTFTFSTSATVAQFTLILRQDGSGGNSVTWPASVKWHSLTAPTILTSANAVHVLEFLTVNSGTTWRGFLASSAAS